MNPSSNLVLVGPMGAGKTSIGRRVAERFGLHFVDMDHYIVEEAGCSIAMIFEIMGEPGFRALEKQTLARLMHNSGQLIATGGGVVLNAENRRCLIQHGFVVYLRTSVEAQLQRLRYDHTRPLLQRDDREQVLYDMAAYREPLYLEVADLVFDTDTLSSIRTTAQLSLTLAAQWQMIPATASLI